LYAVEYEMRIDYGKDFGFYWILVRKLSIKMFSKLIMEMMMMEVE